MRTSRKSDPTRNGRVGQKGSRKKICGLELALEGKREHQHRFLLKLQQTTRGSGKNPAILE